MKLSLIALVTVALMSMTGCASQNAALRYQVDVLQKQAREQDKQIAELESRQAKLKEDSTSTAGSAWNWTTHQAHDAWNSQFSQEARARFQKCWTDLNTSTTAPVK